MGPVLTISDLNSILHLFGRVPCTIGKDGAGQIIAAARTLAVSYRLCVHARGSKCHRQTSFRVPGQTGRAARVWIRREPVQRPPTETAAARTVQISTGAPGGTGPPSQQIGILYKYHL